MADIKPVRTNSPLDGALTMYTWPNISESDNPLPALVPHKADKAFQLLGAFGVGGQVAIQGSNVIEAGSTDWDPLRDTFGTLLDSLTSRTLRQIMEGCYGIRPRVVAGTGVSVTVHLIIVQNQ